MTAPATPPAPDLADLADLFAEIDEQTSVEDAEAADSA